ncbi:MAG: serpin family protein [Planctomyces sp.]|nr:serpin family protein [Planctomyces sp.]
MWRKLLCGGTAAIAAASLWTAYHGNPLDGAPLEKPAPITADARQTANSLSEFSYDVYRTIGKNRTGNVFISPYSVAGALLMVAEGARGDAAEEIGAVLHFPDSVRRSGDAERPWDTLSQLQGFATLTNSLAPAGERTTAQNRERLAKLEQELADVQKAAKAEIRTGRFGNPRREQQLVDEVNALRAGINPYELRVANSVWVDKGFPLTKAYLQAVTGDYGATARPCDFRNRAEAERETMNAWAAEQTRGRIRDPLGPGSVTSDMRVLLMNAVYFKGEWTDPFDEGRTAPKDFFAADGSTLQCQLMDGWRDANYIELRPDGAVNELVQVPAPEDSEFEFLWQWADNPDGLKLVELPYKGGRLSLLALLPNRVDGLAALEDRLTAAQVGTWVESMRSQRVHVLLPRFKMQGQYELTSTLSALGMTRAFVPGGLTGFSDDPEATALALTGAIQATFVELNEKGTEAAAVTVFPAPMAALRREPPKPLPEFRADHPFLFVIQDRETGSPLFIGRVENPGS